MVDEQSTPQPPEPQPEPMTRERAIELLRTDVKAWNNWRSENKEWLPDLITASLRAVDLGGADLRMARLNYADLCDANLLGANLSRAHLIRAGLTCANLSDANLSGACLRETKLDSANLSSAHLVRADLTCANLSGANLSGADLRMARLNYANLSSATLDSSDFSNAQAGETAFGDLDLTNVRGLESIVHGGPSTVGTNTLVASRGRIPAEFLRGCGLQPWEIEAARLYDPALTQQQIIDIQYKVFAARTGPLFLGGIFISYSHDDARFVDKLYDHLLAEGANVWLDRRAAVAGRLQQQVDRAIRFNDVVVLVLSESSVGSDWVKHELKVARRKELEEGRDVLCPVTLDDAWHAKKDDLLWERLTESLILDFSKWKAKAFDTPFQKLIKGLRINFPQA